MTRTVLLIRNRLKHERQQRCREVRTCGIVRLTLRCRLRTFKALRQQLFCMPSHTPIQSFRKFSVPAAFTVMLTATSSLRPGTRYYPRQFSVATAAIYYPLLCSRCLIVCPDVETGLCRHGGGCVHSCEGCFERRCSHTAQTCARGGGHFNIYNIVQHARWWHLL